MYIATRTNLNVFQLFSTIQPILKKTGQGQGHGRSLSKGIIFRIVCYVHTISTRLVL